MERPSALEHVQPPRAAAVDDAIVDKSGGSYQRQSWEALMRSMAANTSGVVLEILVENPVRELSSSRDKAQLCGNDQETEASTDLMGLLQRTIMSATGDLEEEAQKLMSAVRPGQETELCSMLIKRCNTGNYALLAQQLCAVDDPAYQAGFEACFAPLYRTVHRMCNDEARCTAGLYGHLLATNAVSWRAVLGNCVRLTEKDTTCWSRIFIKVLFLELSEHLGIPLLNRRINHEDHVVRDALFPKDSTKNMIFAINFLTSIGLGAVTESAREDLKNIKR